MRALLRLAALLIALAPVAAVAQTERIRDFASDIQVAKSGELTVTETIAVTAAGDAIKHGIQRDFPTSYRNRLGQRTRVGFDVVAVARDGHPEPYELIDLANGKRVRIGRADTLLDAGDHSFVITYHTTRQVLFGKDQDELYWNVTGNGWDFPIDAASARITLPGPAKFGDRAVYTGAQGSTAHDAVVTDEGAGTIAFRTTRPLGREEGLTVAAAFPKGVLSEPTADTRLGWWLQDWAPLAAGIAAALALLWYQARAWWVAGRGPRAGTVVPLFTPPDGLSPAAARYVSRMGMDNRAFTAAIVGLAVKRWVHIDKHDGGWFARDSTTLTRTPGGAALDPAEQSTLDALFKDGDTLELKQENHSLLQGARTTLGGTLDADYVGKLFDHHRDYAVFGLFAVAVAMFAVTLVALLVQPEFGLVGYGVPLRGLMAVAAAYGCWRLTVKLKGWRLALAWLGVTIASIVTVFFGFGALVAALQFGTWPILLPLATLPVALFAFKWMDAPTPAGRAVMDRIAGFKHYLGITEEDRLNTLHPPEKTPELFERYLPYAIALDVENHWADKFAGVLAAAAAAGTTGHALGWYSGGGNVWSDAGGFTQSVGSSLASTVSSAATSPSSGSGGGGSSGGGGGGGGGGGW